MKRNNKLWLLLIALCGLFTACKKTVTPIPTPIVEQLPPATQEGKNTFGCLINGNVWVPYKTDFSRKLEVWYDQFYHLGTLRIISPMQVLSPVSALSGTAAGENTSSGVKSVFALLSAFEPWWQ